MFHIMHNGHKINEAYTMETALNGVELYAMIGYTNLSIVRVSDGRTWNWN